MTSALLRLKFTRVARRKNRQLSTPYLTQKREIQQWFEVLNLIRHIFINFWAVLTTRALYSKSKKLYLRGKETMHHKRNENMLPFIY